jgi:hypothetical protein
MKKFLTIAALLLFLTLYIQAFTFASDGINSCGYEMDVIPVETPAIASIFDNPTIIDAWTTNDPFGNPYSEVYDFTIGQDTIAFVVEYFHTGGLLPEQWARGWNCGQEDQIVKTCYFKWTIGYLPAGVYLLINYFDPVEFPPGEYDWASKVGDVVFGWPNISATRPWCFTIHE